MLTPAQIRAQEIYLTSAILENNFTPNSEVKIAMALKLEGFEASSTSVGRWKKKFEWEKLLHVKIGAAVTEDSKTKAIVSNSSLEATVKNTEVDIKRNNVLIAASYQALEYEANQLLKVVEEGKRPLSEIEFDKLYKIAKLSTDRHDRMLDRLANMPPEAISSQEVYERLKAIPIEYEREEIEEAELVGASQSVTLTHNNEEE